MAFNGSSGSGNATNLSGGSTGNGGNQDGPLNKRLCTGKENNEAGVNNNRVRLTIYLIFSLMYFQEVYFEKLGLNFNTIFCQIISIKRNFIQSNRKFNF